MAFIICMVFSVLLFSKIYIYVKKIDKMLILWYSEPNIEPSLKRYYACIQKLNPQFHLLMLRECTKTCTRTVIVSHFKFFHGIHAHFLLLCQCASTGCFGIGFGQNCLNFISKIWDVWLVLVYKKA